MNAKRLEGFVIAVIIMLVAIEAWNLVPGWRWAAPHRSTSISDVWTVPTNARIPELPCADTLHPGMNWRANADGLCHGRDAYGHLSVGQ